MSKLSQFFGGGGGGGSATGVGGIPVEILGVSGSGGSGGGEWWGCNCSSSYSIRSGEGGGGAVFHATNYSVEPGTTVPITIGGGGAHGTDSLYPAWNCPSTVRSTPGSIGGTTSFNYPRLPLSVIGGGGGSGYLYRDCGCMNGGNGGGPITCLPHAGPPVGIYQDTQYFAEVSNKCDLGKGIYHTSVNCTEMNEFDTCNTSPGGYSWSYGISTTETQKAKGQEFPWGMKYGFPGTGSQRSPGVLNCLTSSCIPVDLMQSRAGRSGGNSPYKKVSIGYNVPSPFGPSQRVRCEVRKTPCAFNYCTSITGSMIEINNPGTMGAVSEFADFTNALCCRPYCQGSYCCPQYPRCFAGMDGNKGGLIIQWASFYGAAPSYPGATDISPGTPGYYTYCFTSSGSITLP